MNNQTYTTRRGNAQNYSAFTSRRYCGRSEKSGLSRFSFVLIVMMLTGIFGLIYITQGTRGSSYDYQISEVESQITEMEAKKEDLAVEQARLTSVANAKTSDVAVAMEDGTVSGYAND